MTITTEYPVSGHMPVLNAVAESIQIIQNVLVVMDIACKEVENLAA
jgi:hypothetical protein